MRGTFQIRMDVQEHGPWRRTLSVTVPGDVVRVEHGKVLKRFASRLELPGFRKGRIPAAVVESQAGPSVQNEAVARVVDEAYQAALAEYGIRPVSETELDAVDYQPEGDLHFRISFDVRPRVELSRLGGFRVEVPSVEVDSRDVDRVLEGLRVEHAFWRPADDDGHPRDTDLVMVRILRLVEGGAPVSDPAEVGLPWAAELRLRAGTHRGRYRLVLGEGDAIPAVEEAIKSLLPGETKDFLVRLPGASGAAGADRTLRITLQERQVRELPELDDAFARSLGDFGGVADLAEGVRRDLREEATARAEAALRARLLDLVLEANPFEVPPSMVTRYRDSMLGEAPGDLGGPDVEVELDREAERAVKHMMALDRIAEAHGLRASTADVDARIAAIAAESQVGEEQVRAQLVQSNRLEELKRALTEAKVFDFLKGQSEIVVRPSPS